MLVIVRGYVSGQVSGRDRRLVISTTDLAVLVVALVGLVACSRFGGTVLRLRLSCVVRPRRKGISDRGIQRGKVALVEIGNLVGTRDDHLADGGIRNSSFGPQPRQLHGHQPGSRILQFPVIRDRMNTDL